MSDSRDHESQSLPPPTSREASEVSQLLQRIQNGETGSTDELFPLVYAELRRLAVAVMQRERPGHTLQPTALVHEAFLRLVSPSSQQHWDSVGHFYSAAAQAMRRILIDNARKKNSLKRGGECVRVEIPVEQLMDFDDERLIKLDQALVALALEDPVKAQLVELRFFAGLTIDQIADVLKISRATVHRYWNLARAWLFLHMKED